MAIDDKAKIQILNVFMDGCVVDPHIGYPRFEVKLSAKDLGLESKDIPQIFLLGKKMLVDKTEIGLFQSLEGRARRECDFYSVPTPIPGLRFVPLKVLSHLEESLVRCKEQFKQRAEDFVKRYDNVKREMLEKYAEYRDSLEKLYPSTQDVASAFKFDWTCFTISLPRRLHAKAVDVRTTEAARTQVNEIVTKKSQDLVRSFDTWSEQIVVNARQAAMAMFQTIKDKMDHGEVIHAKSIQALRDYIDTFRAMNFIGDTRMEDALSAAKDSLEGLNSKFEKDHSKEALDAVLKAATDISDVSGVTGRYKRRLMEFSDSE